MRGSAALRACAAFVLGATMWAGGAAADPPLQLHTDGNKILDSNNKPVRLVGVNCPSLEWSSDGITPDRKDVKLSILKSIAVAIDDWKCNIVRVPLCQDRWFGKAPEQKDVGEKPYREMVDQVVQLCSSKGCYVILDLHWSDCNEWGVGIGQHSLPDENSIAFWKDFAPVYANNPAVLYDLYNEPHDVTWDVWLNGGEITDKPNTRGQKARKYKAVGMQQMLDTIRGAGAKNVVICGGLDWAYDMSGFMKGYTLKDSNGGYGIIYANHAYPMKTPTVSGWITTMQKVSAEVPVIVSEFGGSGGPHRKGRVRPQDHGDDWLLHTLQGIVDNDWSYTAWDLHPQSGPTLISDWDFTPTPDYGVYVKEMLAGTLPKYTPPPPTTAPSTPANSGAGAPPAAPAQQ